MRGLLPVLVMALAGCYSYVAVGGTAPADGADVALNLAAPRDVVLQDVTVHGITAVQGRLLSADSDSVALAVVRLWGLEGRSYEAMGVGVRLPRQGIATVREKRMSRTKSALAIAASSAGIVAMILGVKGLLGSGGGSGPPKPLP